MALDVTARYGSEHDFLVTFNPDRQVDYTKDLTRVFKGSAPSLLVVSEAYGEEIALTWLEVQIYNLSEFAGCRNKITIPQVEETVKLIQQKYGYLNVVEIMLFCQKFKACEYGNFYGSVDPMLILGALKDFVVERNRRLAEYEREEIEQKKSREETKLNELKDLFRKRYPSAFKNDEELGFSDFNWGCLYELTQEEWDKVVPWLLAKNLPKGQARYEYFRNVVEEVVRKRKI